jgi:hypothetical protein
VQITTAIVSFRSNIIGAFIAPSEYSSVVGATLSSTSIPMDAIPHFLSRAVTIAFGILCIAGFTFIVFKRKLRKIDTAIFLTGAVYSGLGVALSVLGTRAIALVFIPVSIGIIYPFQRKFRKYLNYLVVALLIFVVFVSIHQSLTSEIVAFQTKEDLVTSNFMLEKYDWNSNSVVLVSSPASFYISPQIQGNTEIDTDITPRFGLLNITLYDSILYSVDLGNRLNMSNISVEATSQRLLERFDVVYNSGNFYIATKSR